MTRPSAPAPADSPALPGFIPTPRAPKSTDALPAARAGRAPTVIFCLAVILLSPLSPARVFGQEEEETREQKIARLRVDLLGGDEGKRREATSKLAVLGKDAVPALVEGLRTEKNPEVLNDISRAFEEVGKDAVPALIDTLKDETSGAKDIKVLRYTSNALKFIASKSRGSDPLFADAVPHLMKILENKRGLEAQGSPNDVLEDYDAAADCLEWIGKEAKEAVPLLIELVENEKNREEKESYYRKRGAVIAIVEDLTNHGDFSANEKITDAFNKHRDGMRVPDRILIDGKIKALQLEEKRREYERSLRWATLFAKYPALAPIALVVSLIFLGWLAVYLLKPIWLLKINELFPAGETRVSGVLGAVTVPLQHLLAPCVFRPRVLDAWVKKHLPKAHECFLKKTTVNERRIYVPVGLFLDGKLVPKFTPKELRETFSRNQSRLLISGVGGSGKTSLACQIAGWAMKEKAAERPRPEHLMLPVLLEDDFASHGEDALREAIRAQLFDSVDAGTLIPNALLQSLLEKKRVLVLVDGMSERNEETQAAILLGITRIPTNAVVFTSRSDEPLGQLNKTVIKPTTIKGGQLSSFVEAYLTSLGKKELFEDKEFFEGCSLLSEINNDREITALLAKLFVDLMVEKQEKTFEEDLPRSIPGLMLRSIEVLHRKTPADAPPLRDVIKAAKVIAWECLKKDYRPLPADYEDVRESLLGLPNGEKSLDYLKDRLKLIETTSCDSKIRFKIDPLAEYLAGMYLVEENRYSEKRWRKFIETASSKAGAPENITGFLLAVRDCCMTEEVEDEVMNSVIRELTEMTKAQS